MANISSLKEVLLEGLIRRVLCEDGTQYSAEELPGKVFQPFMAKIFERATERQAAMRDRDESFLVDSLVGLLDTAEPDVARATELLKERQAQLARRSQTTPDDQSEPAAAEASAPNSEATEATALDAEAVAGKWNQACDGLLSVGCDSTALPAENQVVPQQGSVWGDQTPEALQSQLATQGWVQSQLPIVESTAGLFSGLERIESLNFPPPFVWLFDQSWQLLTTAWGHAEQMMGCPCVLDTNQVTSFHLKHRDGNRGKTYVGANFGTPHRDQTYGDTHDSEGRVKIVHMWVPLNDVCVDNGCMYVLPREFDQFYEADNAPAHMHLHEEAADATGRMIWFPLEGVRPLVGKAGTLMAWTGCAVHWGSACKRVAADRARASMAFVFRRADAVHDPENPPLTREQVEGLDAKQRLDLIVLQRKSGANL